MKRLKKIKFAIENPPKTATIRFEGDIEPHASEDTENVTITVRDRPSEDAIKNIEGFVTPMTPQGQLERARRLLEAYGPSTQGGLTVGDLSLVDEKKREERRRRKEQGLDAQDEMQGLSVGNLYQGPRASDIKPHISESQKIAADMIEKGLKRTREIARIKEYMQQQEP